MGVDNEWQILALLKKVRKARADREQTRSGGRR